MKPFKYEAWVLPCLFIVVIALSAIRISGCSSAGAGESEWARWRDWKATFDLLADERGINARACGLYCIVEDDYFRGYTPERTVEDLAQILNSGVEHQHESDLL